MRAGRNVAARGVLATGDRTRRTARRRCAASSPRDTEGAPPSCFYGQLSDYVEGESILLPALERIFQLSLSAWILDYGCVHTTAWDEKRES